MTSVFFLLGERDENSYSNYFRIVGNYPLLFGVLIWTTNQAEVEERELEQAEAREIKHKRAGNAGKGKEKKCSLCGFVLGFVVLWCWPKNRISHMPSLFNFRFPDESKRYTAAGVVLPVCGIKHKITSIQ